MVFGQQNRLDKQTDLVAIHAQSNGSVEPFIISHCRNNDSHINVAPLIGIAFGVGAEQDNLDLSVKTG